MTRESREFREQSALDREAPHRDARAHATLRAYKHRGAQSLDVRGGLTFASADIMNGITADLDNSRVLVVADKADVAPVVAAALAGEGHQVRTATDGQAALARFSEWRPGLVLTDLDLPIVDGLELCRQIRARSRVPIIVVSRKVEEAVIVEALDSGADDYVAKPFGTRELLARIRATLRRAGSDFSHESFQTGTFHVNMDTRRVEVRETEVRLTPKEFELFVYMARRPNQVLDHRRLLGAVWGDASLDQPEYLRVYMGQLRKKLEPNPSRPRYLLTELRVGYTFNPEG